MTNTKAVSNVSLREVLRFAGRQSNPVKHQIAALARRSASARRHALRARMTPSGAKIFNVFVLS